MTTSPDKLTERRKAFEDWIKLEWPNFYYFERHMTGQYVNKDLRLVFTGWNAALDYAEENAKREVTVTDEMVERAARKLAYQYMIEQGFGEGSEDAEKGDMWLTFKTAARLALTAALDYAEGKRPPA